MTDLSRRGFLRGFVAVAGAAVVPAVIADMALPMIVGNGVHDDTAGLRAAFEGEPFSCPSGLVSSQDGSIVIRNGVFKLTDTITFGPSKHPRYVTDSTFLFSNLSEDQPMVRSSKPEGPWDVMTNCILRSDRPSSGIQYVAIQEPFRL